MSEVKAKKIPQNVLDLADKMEKHLILEKNTITDKPEETAFAATLPDNLTMQMVADLENHNRLFIQAGNLALGRMANNAIAADPTLNEVTGDIAFGVNNRLKSVTDRTRTQHVPSTDGTTKQQEIKGNTYCFVRVKGADRADPVIKQIRNELRDEANGRW